MASFFTYFQTSIRVARSYKITFYFQLNFASFPGHVPFMTKEVRGRVPLIKLTRNLIVQILWHFWEERGKQNILHEG